MKSLFAKLSLALLLVVSLLGSGFFMIERYSTQNYYEEITQRLNASIAMYVTGERQLMENFVVNNEALTLLAQQAMVINPTVEIFLLDIEGNILAHALPPESILRNRVDLVPVKALIGGNVEMPLRGTDPRNLDREKIFSAFPVKHNDVLQGYLYAVLGGAKYDELANSIRDSYVQRLGELIGDLFELSKLDSASIHATVEAFSLAELLHDIVHEYELDANKRQVKLAVEAPFEPSIVYADIGLVQRVLENLIRNALKFTPAGGHINIRLDKKPGAVAVAIEDTGCGIPEKDLEHVFDRFYRAENTTQAHTSNAGLGLAIVRKILDLHGSRITVSSQVNQGTCFEFDLPTQATA